MKRIALLIGLLTCLASSDWARRGVDYNRYTLENYLTQVKTVGVPQQGMDICKGQIFALHDGGTCHVYDLRTKAPLGHFALASQRKGNHSNTANFGIERVKGATYPVLYVSLGKPGDRDEFVCYVESITRKNGQFSSQLVQSIRFDQSDFTAHQWQPIWGCPNWVVDKERGFLWAFSAIKRTIVKVTGPFSSNKYVATKFRLPRLAEGAQVTLTAADVLDQAIMEFDAYATQGGTMKDGKIYYAFGFGKVGTKTPAKIRVYDTDKRTIVGRLDLEGQVNEEPEDISIYRGALYLNTNSNKIYRFAFPKKL